MQFQIFMGMIGDPENYFTGGIAATHNTLRIDKMLADGVRGALDLIKTALPTDISPSREATEYNFSGNRRPSSDPPKPHSPPLQSPTRTSIELRYDNDASGRRLRQAVLNYIDRYRRSLGMGENDAMSKNNGNYQFH